MPSIAHLLIHLGTMDEAGHDARDDCAPWCPGQYPNVPSAGPVPTIRRCRDAGRDGHRDRRRAIRGCRRKGAGSTIAEGTDGLLTHPVAGNGRSDFHRTFSAMSYQPSSVYIFSPSTFPPASRVKMNASFDSGVTKNVSLPSKKSSTVSPGIAEW